MRLKMKIQIAAATKIIDAPANEIYKIIADYRNSHPLILPRDYFISLEVEEGGYGEGTIVNFKMRLLGQIQSFRSLITEPMPGRQLVETDIKSQIPTSFLVAPLANGNQGRLTITTELVGKSGAEGFVAKWVLQKVYRDELELIAQAAEDSAAFRGSNALSETLSLSLQ
jgi:hypothetical protein